MGTLPGCTPSTARVSVAADGSLGTYPFPGPNTLHSITQDGHFVVFSSRWPFTVGGTEGLMQLRFALTGF
jgi:hypothetical protein